MNQYKDQTSKRKIKENVQLKTYYIVIVNDNGYIGMSQ